MYFRIASVPEGSFFLFGARGTGKSSWVKERFPDAVYVDLLESEVFSSLLSSPQRLDAMIPQGFKGRVVIDEIQKIPGLLDEVHRLIESRKLKFALTGSSARKLRRGGANLLAGRAVTSYMFPLTAEELGEDFNLADSLKSGHMPAVFQTKQPMRFLKSYVHTYLTEEIQFEGLTRNLGAFARFLEVASLSQGQPINISAIARDCSVHRKVVEDYFSILRDLLLAYEIPVFTKRAKRKMAQHPKFYFFDVGVFRAIRPRGPLDSPEEIDGPALETLVLQEIMALNSNLELGYGIYHWRTSVDKSEVDFVLYGDRGLKAIEVKRSARLREADFAALEAFTADYPVAETWLVYGGTREYSVRGIKVVPAEKFLRGLRKRLE